jgi:hypothetical protein
VHPAAMAALAISAGTLNDMLYPSWAGECDSFRDTVDASSLSIPDELLIESLAMVDTPCRYVR